MIEGVPIQDLYQRTERRPDGQFRNSPVTRVGTYTKFEELKDHPHRDIFLSDKFLALQSSPNKKHVLLLYQGAALVYTIKSDKLHLIFNSIKQKEFLAKEEH